MQYRTIADLSALVRGNIHCVPHDVDVVVGVPRSGMLPAMMIALYLNKRVSDLDSFIDGRIYEAGVRSQYVSHDNINKVLIVDDSVRSGSAIGKAKKKIQDAGISYQFVYLAPIVTSESKDLVDIFFEIIDDERIFEWNLFHHSMLNDACLDIDGVLNVDPKFETDDDGESYIRFLKTAKPLFIPTAPIDTLISCRLEKYRTYTEHWLKQYNVQYKHLVMLDLPSKAARLKWNKHGLYKAQYYLQHSELRLFIESSQKQAQIIADYTQKPVICIETNSLVLPSEYAYNRKQFRRAIRRRFPSMYAFAQKLFKKN